MAETTEFVSTIRVKDLISAFESKSDLVRVEFSRPRAKSVGNILAKNVVVQQNEFNSLDDIEKALRKLETNLNFYEVYNKEKHVAFQEQLFNILTSIVNIEGTGDDATARKKRLISKTQTLVSFLNQKLPSNTNQLLKSSPVNQYKYTTYSNRVKENGAEDETKPSKQNFAIYSENTNAIDVTDSGEQFLVSVKKLKENFQPKDETRPEDPLQNEKKKSKSSEVNGNKEVTKEEIPEDKKTEEENPENVSVSKLRNLFEKRSEETSKGLGIITDDKPQETKLIYSANVNIPYTERNLGNVRLQRSVSGNYMNYVGLLKRVDISKSTSELNKEFAGSAGTDRRKDSSAGESEGESEKSLDTVEERKSVKEIRKIYSNPSTLESDRKDKDSLSAGSDEESENSLDTVEERKSVQEIRKIYSNSSLDNSEVKITKNIPDVLDKEKVSILGDNEEIKVKYSTTITVNDSKPTETAIINNNENKFSTEGFKEIEVNYFTESSDDITKDKPKEIVATIEGTEEEVNYSIAKSNTISSKDDVAILNGAVEENVTFSTATPDNTEKETKLQESSATVEGTEQEKVHYSIALSHDVSTKEEDISTLNGAEENVTFSPAIPDDTKTTNENNAADIGVTEAPTEYAILQSEKLSKSSKINTATTNPDPQSTQSIQADVTDYAFIKGSNSLDREQSLIEEEIDKIDVEETLAGEDIVVNAEDLKNADNDFEKLLESSGADKTVS